MMKLNPLKMGVIALAIAFAMGLVDLLWRPIFVFRPTD